jgi:hydrogenase maturation factor
MDDASDGAPGTDLVPLTGTRVLPRELARAIDVALGAGMRAGGVAVRVVGAGRDAARIGTRVVVALPGAGLAGRALARVARPLAADGERVRERTVAETQRALEWAVPAIVELIDIDAIVRRIDVNAVVAAVDVDALLQRADVDALVRRVDMEAVLASIDLDELIGRIDIDAIAARIDVNAVVRRVDVDAVVEQTELGTIVARSTSGFASEALDVARAQTVGVDTLVTRLVDRLLRRRGEGPLGPPLLVGEDGEPLVPPEASPPPPTVPPEEPAT